MSWQPATDYTTDYQPVRTMRVKKMIWSDEDQAFQTHYFLRVTCDNPRIWTDAREWLESQFGPGWISEILVAGSS